MRGLFNLYSIISENQIYANKNYISFLKNKLRSKIMRYAPKSQIKRCSQSLLNDF